MTAGARSSGRAAFVFIFITVALDMLALGVTIPVLPRLIVELGGGDLRRAALLTGAFNFIWAAAQFVFSPAVGALSDRVGRRPVVLLSNFGLGADYLLMAFSPSIGWLFLGRVISGVTSASYPTAAAYIADVTPPEKRAGQLGMLGAAFGLGFVVGPAVGGLLGAYGLRVPFFAAAAMSLVNAACGFFVLPESLPKERRAAGKIAFVSPLASVALLRSHRVLVGLAVASFLSYVAHESLPSIYVLYASYRFGWDERTVGLSLAAIGLSSAIVSAVLVGVATERLGDRVALVVGLGAGALGFLVYGCTWTSAGLFAGIPLLALWGLAEPAMGAIMSRHVPPDEQGRLQGTIASLHGITGMLGPLVFSTALARSLQGAAGKPTGVPWLVAAAFVVASVVVAAGATARARAPSS